MTTTTTQRAGAAHNLGTVFSFEVRRTLKRPTFWATTLSVPILLVGFLLLINASGRAAVSGAAAERQVATFTYADASGLIDPTVAAKQGGSVAADPAAARTAVINGQAPLFISYPADPSTQPIEVVGKDIGVTESGAYGEIARSVLADSIQTKVADPRIAAILTSAPAVDVATYADGRQTPGMLGVFLPGAFIVLFYMAILLLGNQMLNITVEEKENRVTEMILTTIHPTTLIAGKLLALVAVGFVQAVVLFVPMLTLPVLFATNPGAGSSSGAAGELTNISTDQIAAAFNGPAIALGAALFVGAFLMFTGLLISIGAIMPTAKDAGSAFAAVVLALFLPIYAGGVLIGDPHGVASEALTFFPLTAPLSAMLRNALGTLLPWETALVLVIIYGSAAVLLTLGVRLFRTGSISYDARLNLRKALGFRRG